MACHVLPSSPGAVQVRVMVVGVGGSEDNCAFASPPNTQGNTTRARVRILSDKLVLTGTSCGLLIGYPLLEGYHNYGRGCIGKSRTGSPAILNVLGYSGLAMRVTGCVVVKQVKRCLVLKQCSTMKHARWDSLREERTINFL